MTRRNDGRVALPINVFMHIVEYLTLPKIWQPVAASEFETYIIGTGGTLVKIQDHSPDIYYLDFVALISASLGPIISVSTSLLHTCLIHANGDLTCFGNNNRGQCNVPLDLDPVITVAASGAHTVAILGDESLLGFGYNDCGQCNLPPNISSVALMQSANLKPSILGMHKSVRMMLNRLEQQVALKLF